MQTALINLLRNPAVRDLAWVIAAPGLLDAEHPAYRGRVVSDAWCSARLQDCVSWLIALDQNPHTLHDFIAACPTRRLGHYFETLIRFWLMHLPDTQIIATNLQVHEELRTVGEYDFLFRNSNAEVCHWEAAVKFYLQVEPRPEQRKFIGPGTRDRLDIKLDHVFNHQLLLGQTHAGRTALPRGVVLGRAQAYIKGYLFYHVSTPGRMEVAGVSASHQSGWWLRHQEDQLPQTSTDSHWIIPSRLHWLAPLRLAENAMVMSSSTLAAALDAHFCNGSESTLVIELLRDECGEWREVARGFVVCGTWPVIGDTPNT